MSLPPNQDVVNIDNVQRIRMHDPHYYTFFCARDKELSLHEVHFAEAPHFLLDVPVDQPMSVICRNRSTYRGDSYCDSGVIHVHATKDIEGGGWNQE